MWFGVISTFPDMFDALKNYGITSYAYKKNILSIDCFNPKSYTKKNIYDKPYGGGKGVVMSYHPLSEAIKDARSKCLKPLVIYVSPKGKLVDNNLILKMSKLESIIFVSGRYEEIDYRIIEDAINLEISIGDFIVSGGELPIMIIIDSITRLLPNVIKNADSVNIESFNNNLLDYNQYTRPRFIKNGICAPRILLSGNHYKISKWRYKQRLGYTFFKRPDLLYNKKLSMIEKYLLKDFIIKKNSM